MNKETTPALVKIEFVGEARLIFDAAVAANGAKVLRDFADEIEDDTMVSMAESVARSYIARLAREEADEIQERARLLLVRPVSASVRLPPLSTTPSTSLRDLIDAAMGYLVTAGDEDANPYTHYPWMDFERGTPREHLTKAGAFIAAALALMDAAESAE